MTTNKVPVLTIDGPSGVGKGSTALRLANQLGWQVLDSGAIYRVLAFVAQTQSLDLKDEQGLLAIITTLTVDFKPLSNQKNVAVWWNQQDISADIRTESAGAAASKVAVLPKVRQALLQWQRDFRQGKGLVADGRDMGTVVFPNAATKIFLTASAEIRAKRRYKQLKEKGMNANMPAILQELQQRDERDRNRLVAPLKPADDAIVIDTSDLSIDEVVNKVLINL